MVLNYLPGMQAYLNGQFLNFENAFNISIYLC